MCARPDQPAEHVDTKYKGGQKSGCWSPVLIKCLENEGYFNCLPFLHYGEKGSESLLQSQPPRVGHGVRRKWMNLNIKSWLTSSSWRRVVRQTKRSSFCKRHIGSLRLPSVPFFKKQIFHMAIIIKWCALRPTHQRRPPTSRTPWPCFLGWRRLRASAAGAALWPPPWLHHHLSLKWAAGAWRRAWPAHRSPRRDSGLRGSPPHSPAPHGPQPLTLTQAPSRRPASPWRPRDEAPHGTYDGEGGGRGGFGLFPKTAVAWLNERKETETTQIKKNSLWTFKTKRRKPMQIEKNRKKIRTHSSKSNSNLC